MGYKGRDVEVSFINEEQCVVIACDSCGAIGLKEMDMVKINPSTVGKLTAKVALMEVISVGAIPKMLSVAICNEPSPTGDSILNGVRQQLKEVHSNYCDFNDQIPIAISTEKNIITSQTSLGITVVGLCKKNNLRISASKIDDFVYCIGKPKVGNEITEEFDTEIASITHIRELQKNNKVHDIVPVGSQGVLKEVEMLASNSNLKFALELTSDELDIYKTAGPSTCIIFTTQEDIFINDFLSTPIYKIGRLFDNI